MAISQDVQGTSRQRLEEALDVVASQPEGMALIDKARESGFSIGTSSISPFFGGTVFSKRLVLLDESMSAAMMASYAVHELFHVSQYADNPVLARSVDAFSGMGAVPRGADDTLLRPHDYLWARMIMEMAAFAVQTDFTAQYTARTGDNGLEVSNPARADIYRAICARKTLGEIDVVGRRVMTLENGADIDGFQRDYAAAAVGYMWYWRAQTAEGADRPARLHYNDFMTATLRRDCRSLVSPLFQAAARGEALPRFIEWGRKDIVRLGAGYPVNPLDVPGFEDVCGPDYRDALTPRNRAVLLRVERALGLG